MTNNNFQINSNNQSTNSKAFGASYLELDNYLLFDACDLEFITLFRI